MDAAAISTPCHQTLHLRRHTETSGSHS